MEKLLVLLAVTLSTARLADSVMKKKRCVTGCQCRFESYSFTVSCRPGHSIPDAERMYRLLDSRLSSDVISQRLTSLAITGTPLTHIPASVCQLLNLTSLNLDRNNLTALPDNCFTNLTELVEFSANNNSILGLQDGLFDGLHNLESISLSRNKISYIGLQVFSNSSELTNLREVDLSYNKLTHLEPWWYFRCTLGNESSAVNINIVHNLVSNFTNEMNFEFRYGMESPFGLLDVGNNKIAHVSDMLRGWNLSYTGFMVLSNFEGLRPHMRFQFAGSSFSCDCTDFEFYKLADAFTTFDMVDRVRCGTSEANAANSAITNAMHAIRIPLLAFECELTERCPSGCRCVYRPANATLHVYCSEAGLSSLPPDLPPLPKSYARYKLDFSNNKLLRRVEYRWYLVNTAILDVSDCSITDVDLDAWRGFAEMRPAFVTPEVFLQQNYIETVPFEVTSINFTETRMSLRNNLWKCYCEQRWLVTWFRHLFNASLIREEIFCASPPRMEGRSICRFSEDDFCDIHPATKILNLVMNATLLCALTVAVTSVVVYRLRVRVYRKWNFHPFDRDECVGEDMDYDVFLCCSSDDHRAHGRCILELLESKGFRVCYHMRDFLAGEIIMDNICQAIHRSKRTLCVLSHDFLKSSFCMTEFDMAFHHNVAVLRKKRLIVLMALDGAQLIDLYAREKSDTVGLRQHLRQYTYIDYTAGDWLDTLLYALPLRGLLQSNSDGDWLFKVK